MRLPPSQCNYISVGERSFDRLTGQPVICIGSASSYTSHRVVLAKGGVVYGANRSRFQRHRLKVRAFERTPEVLRLAASCRNPTGRRRSMHWDLHVEAGGRILANLFDSLWPDAEPLWPIVCPDVTVPQDWRADVPVPEDYYA